MNKFCMKCGAPLEPGSIFCSRCGARIVNITEKTGTASGVNVRYPANGAMADQRPAQTKASAKKGLLIGICCAGAVILLVLAFLVISAVLGKLVGSKGGDNAPVIGMDSSTVTLTLSEYVDAYNSVLRGTVSSSINTNVSDSNYIACAKTLINKALKNPSTAQYNNASVYEKDSYGRAIVYLDVSAQNSFGGWVRSEYYVCIQSYSNDGTFTYDTFLSYVDDAAHYDYLLLLNDFGEDPADKELKGMLFDYADFVCDEPAFSLSPSQSLICYKLVFDYGIQYAYVDANTEKVVSVQNTFSNTSGHTNDCEKICAASVAALTDTSIAAAEKNIANVLNFSSFTPTDTPAYYKNGYVYDCAVDLSAMSMAVTAISKRDYQSGLYWSPNNEDNYYEALADEYAASGDFDNAIVYYEQAQIYNDKLNAAYYGKAEQSLAAGDLDNAGLYFSYAGDYEDAAVRVLEVFYSAGQQHEEDNDYISAIYSYSMAGDYPDATAKCKECFFKQGEIRMSEKNYLEAAAYFEGASDYSGALEKYKEANYLYGEQLLKQDQVEEADTYFRNARGYSDADTRIQRYYYDAGGALLKSADYLAAAEKFVLARDYLDSTTKEKECYYEYGKEQLALGYTTSGISYMEKCRGFKDADEYVLSQYFKEAEALFNTYMSTKKRFDQNYEPTYETVRSSLERCEGYSDSGDMISVLDTVHGLWLSAKKAFQMVTATKPALAIYTYHMESFTSAYTDNTITLYEKSLQNGYNKNNEATIITDCSKSYFKATIKDIFDGSPWGEDCTDITRCIIAMFTENYDDIDLRTHLYGQDDLYRSNESWSAIPGGYKTEINYGGYNIVITSTHENYGHTDLVIEAIK